MVNISEVKDIDFSANVGGFYRTGVSRRVSKIHTTHRL